MLLPHRSVAVHVIVVTPSGNVLPDGGLQTTTGDGSPVSVAVAVYVWTAPAGLVASFTASGGMVSTGGVVSPTVFVNVPVVLLPDASVAVHVIVVTPIGNMLPDGGLQVTVGDGSALSVAVAEYVWIAPLGPVASLKASGGRCSTGGVVSGIVIEIDCVPNPVWKST